MFLAWLHKWRCPGIAFWLILWPVQTQSHVLTFPVTCSDTKLRLYLPYDLFRHEVTSWPSLWLVQTQSHVLTFPVTCSDTKSRLDLPCDLRGNVGQVAAGSWQSTAISLVLMDITGWKCTARTPHRAVCGIVTWRLEDDLSYLNTFTTLISDLLLYWLLIWSTNLGCSVSCAFVWCVWWWWCCPVGHECCILSQSPTSGFGPTATRSVDRAALSPTPPSWTWSDCYRPGLLTPPRPSRRPVPDFDVLPGFPDNLPPLECPHISAGFSWQLTTHFSGASSSSLQTAQGSVHVAVHDELGCLFGIRHRIYFWSTGPGSRTRSSWLNSLKMSEHVQGACDL